MASRAEQKAQARAQRIEYERKLAEDAKRKQRLLRLAGVVIAAAVVIVAAIVISSSNNSGGTPIKVTSPQAIAAQQRVNSLLAGIPQAGTTLGNPTARVQVTFYGDLQCSACDTFALPTTINTSGGTPGSGFEDQLINQYVKTGKASLVYRSLETATGTGASPSLWLPQQAAALAAGLQGKAWQYIQLFYNEQLSEGSNYTQQFLDGIAKQVQGLNYNKWLSDLNNPTLAGQVTSDGNAASAAGYSSTPTIVVKGPKGQSAAISGVPQSFGQIQQAIKQAGG